MPAQWFFVPYLRYDSTPFTRGRVIRLAEHSAAIRADGGDWASFECGGGPGSDYILGVAGCKVGGVQQATLDAINATPGAFAIPPKWLDLDASLSTATSGERTFLMTTLRQGLGYTSAELDAWLGLGPGANNAQRNAALDTRTFGNLLDFLNTRRYTVVWDSTAPSQTGYPNPAVGTGPNNNVYPGTSACDGRTVAGTRPGTSVPRDPGTTPGYVASVIPST